jgi:hypothetical protein
LLPWGRWPSPPSELSSCPSQPLCNRKYHNCHGNSNNMVHHPLHKGPPGEPATCTHAHWSISTHLNNDDCLKVRIPLGFSPHSFTDMDGPDCTQQYTVYRIVFSHNM